MNIKATYANVIRNVFMSGAGYGDLERISDEDQKRFAEWEPPQVGAFLVMEKFIDQAAMPKFPAPTMRQVNNILSDIPNGRIDGISASKGGRAWLDGEFCLDELEALCLKLRDIADNSAEGAAELINNVGADAFDQPIEHHYEFLGDGARTVRVTAESYSQAVFKARDRMDTMAEQAGVEPPVAWTLTLQEISLR